MSLLPKPCKVIDCPNLVYSKDSTCIIHRKKPQYKPKPQYNWRWRQLASRAIEEHKRQYGNWCPGYRVPHHAASDLTADHLLPVSKGGTAEDGIRILCRSCNSRRNNNR